MLQVPMTSSPQEFPQQRLPLVSVIGAGKVGSTLAQRLLERDLADVVLLDVVEGLPQGIALDLMEAKGIEGHSRRVVGSNDYADSANSDVVVITAGLPRRPGMSRDDLLATNAKIVQSAAKQAIAYSPNAILIVVTNPLDVMTYIAWQATELPPQRVLGMAGVLDSARFQTFIAWELGVSMQAITAMVLGGHGDLMVPLPRYSTVNGIPITDLMESDTIERLAERTRNGGAEVVKLLQTGGAFYAPASAACEMVEAILQQEPRLIPAASYLQGEYGLKDVFIGVPCYLGGQGVDRILELPLTEEELAALHTSAASVKESIQAAIALLNAE